MRVGHILLSSAPCSVNVSNQKKNLLIEVLSFVCLCVRQEYICYSDTGDGFSYLFGVQIQHAKSSICAIVVLSSSSSSSFHRCCLIFFVKSIFFLGFFCSFEKCIFFLLISWEMERIWYWYYRRVDVLLSVFFFFVFAFAFHCANSGA